MSWFSQLFTPQNLTLAGVGVSLAGGLARAVFVKPQQRAQIDTIERKADLILNQVSQVLPAVQSASRNAARAASVGTNLDSAGASDLSSNLSLALNVLPASAKPDLDFATPEIIPPTLTSVQGGAP